MTKRIVHTRGYQCIGFMFVYVCTQFRWPSKSVALHIPPNVGRRAMVRCSTTGISISNLAPPRLTRTGSKPGSKPRQQPNSSQQLTSSSWLGSRIASRIAYWLAQNVPRLPTRSSNWRWFLTDMKELAYY